MTRKHCVILRTMHSSNPQAVISLLAHDVPTHTDAAAGKQAGNGTSLVLIFTLTIYSNRVLCSCVHGLSVYTGSCCLCS
jgi:hypothetical protein